MGDYYIDEEKYNELKVFEVKAGDLIISCSGTVGKVAVAPETMEKGIINQALLKITLNQNMLTNDYFKILFSAYYMKTETLTDLKGTAQKNMVSVKTLKSEPFPYPPYEELFRIVAKVDELMALCDQLEQQTEDSLTAHQTLVETLLNSLLDAAQTYPGHASGLSDDTVLDIKADIQSHKNKTNSDPFQQTWQRIWENFDALFTTEHSIDQLKQTILQLAVMGKLVPQDPNDEPASVLLEKIAAEKEQLLKDKKIKPQKKAKVFDQSTTPSLLPAGWMSVDFGDVTFNRDAERIPLSVSDRNMRQGEYDYYGASGVIDSIDDYLYDKPLLLIGEDGANLVNRSTPIAFMAYGKYWVNNHAHVLDGINEQFLIYLSLYINSISLLPYITGMAQPKMNQAKMNSILVLLPPEAEQPRIVAKVDELMALCDSLKERIHESQTTQLYLADAMAEQALN